VISDSELELGPIDFLIVVWSPYRQPTGEALLMLVDRGVVRVLELVFVRVEEDGAAVKLDLEDLDDIDLGNPEPCASRERRPTCSAKTTSRKRERCSRADRPLPSPLTRTPGRHRSPPHCAAATPNSSRTARRHTTRRGSPRELRCLRSRRAGRLDRRG
jgi:hypothetical protein